MKIVKRIIIFIALIILLIGAFITYQGYSIYKTAIEEVSIKDKIIPRDWYVGKLTLDNLDYLNVYKSKSYTKIGMLTLGDLFVNDLNNIFTLSRGIEDDTIINIIDDSGNIYGDMISNRHYVRPAFSLNARFSIISGIGSIDGPYEIGDIDE